MSSRDGSRLEFLNFIKLGQLGYYGVPEITLSSWILEFYINFNLLDLK